MLDSHLQDHLEQILSEQYQQAIRFTHITAQGGGCINQAYQLNSDSRRWFIKLNHIHHLAMFEAEADGLKTLASCTSFKVPNPIRQGQFGSSAYLLMEYINLTPMRDQQQFGAALRQLHSIEGQQFGYHRNNFIGTTPQSNKRRDNWFDFFMQERLEYQLKLLNENGLADSLKPLWSEFCTACEALFLTHTPVPSLLHGDLWQGNVSQAGSMCCLYDPACYFGDAEADLAMLTLFGQPDAGFYQAYDASLFSRPGLKLRSIWYNLYHIMNHGNLFGHSYITQAKQMMKSIINQSL